MHYFLHFQYKKNCFASSKEREKMYDQLAAAKAGRGKNMTEKDISKVSSYSLFIGSFFLAHILQV